LTGWVGGQLTGLFLKKDTVPGCPLGRSKTTRPAPLQARSLNQRMKWGLFSSQFLFFDFSPQPNGKDDN